MRCRLRSSEAAAAATRPRKASRSLTTPSPLPARSGRGGRTRSRARCEVTLSSYLRNPSARFSSLRSQRGGGRERLNRGASAPEAAPTAERQTAFSTRPLLRQRVQTYARVGEPPSSTRTRWRLGLNRRLVATIEWLRL